MNGSTLKPNPSTAFERFVPAVFARPCAALILAVCLAVMPAAINSAQAESRPTSWVGDLPIMDGMVIEPELGFAFDSPGGRIVLVFAASGEGEGGVLSFYNSALANLHAETLKIVVCCACEHRTRAVVITEHQRSLDCPGCEHNLLRPDAPKTLAG